MGDLVWLASYPKSGNTWFRILLANLLDGADGPIDINGITTGVIASGRWAFDDVLGVPSADLTADEVDALRPAVFRAIAASEGRSYHKIHDALVPVPGADDGMILPLDVTAAAVYLVRNPLDVAVSYAHHAACGVDDVIAWMGDDTRTIAGATDRLEDQLRQHLLTWHGHVASWLDQDRFPVHVVRYEDLVADTETTFAAAATFLGVPADPDAIARAVEHSRFDGLREQEAATGFAERAPYAASFFREGRAGSWRSVLTDAQVATLVDQHGPMMQRLGYLDADGGLRC